MYIVKRGFRARYLKIKLKCCNWKREAAYYSEIHWLSRSKLRLSFKKIRNAIELNILLYH